MRRQSGGSRADPVNHGDYPFLKDRNRFARVHYSGNTSPVSVSNKVDQAYAWHTIICALFIYKIIASYSTNQLITMMVVRDLLFSFR